MMRSSTTPAAASHGPVETRCRDDTAAWPCVPAAREFALDASGAAVRAKCETDVGVETVRAPLPLVLTTAERLIKPVRPAPEALEAARGRPIETLSIAQLGFTSDDVGLAGSPTRVTGIRPVESSRSPTIVSEGTPRQRADRTVRLLRNAGGVARPDDAFAPWPETGAPHGRPVEVWVLADVEDGALRPATAEHIGLARTLAAPVGGSVVALVLGPPGTESLAPAAAAAGADHVLVGLSERLAPYTSEAWRKWSWMARTSATMTGAMKYPQASARSFRYWSSAVGFPACCARSGWRKPAFPIR